MPNIGNGIESLINLKTNMHGVLSQDKFKNQDEFILINDDNIFNPWKLVLKK